MQVNCIKKFPGFFTIVMLHRDSKIDLHSLSNLLKLYCIIYVIHDISEYHCFQSIDAQQTVFHLYSLKVLCIFSSLYVLLSEFPCREDTEVFFLAQVSLNAQLKHFCLQVKFYESHSITGTQVQASKPLKAMFIFFKEKQWYGTK